MKNFKYVFTSGQSIDSLFVGGSLIEHYFNSPVDGGLVGLSLEKEVLIPYYYTFSDSEGNFSLENIAVGEYVIFAILDKNNNQKHDTINQ